MRPPQKKNGRKPPPRQQAAPPKPSGERAALKLTVQGIANGGYGVASGRGRTIFLPYSIPGEVVEARLLRSEGKVDFAEGQRLIEASADRVRPTCEHFGPGRCWGCHWQHISYEAQLLLKQELLADQLWRLGRFEDAALLEALLPIIPSPRQWGYNHQITLERLPQGGWGLPRAEGRSLEPINECSVLHPALHALYETLDIDFDELARLTLRLGSDGATMLILGMSSEEAPELSADFPTSANALLPGNEPLNLFGDAASYYQVFDRTLRVTAGSFYRPNAPQVPQLVQAVLDLLQPQPEDAILDLYAGVGVFSAFLAPQVSLVTLVESYPPAVTDADENLRAFDNVDVLEGSVEEVLATLLDEGARYDCAIVDPPGRGLSADALARLLELAPERIVYVSGSPAALARDGRLLVEAGYRLHRIQPLDFAPQTYYVEAVALFLRSEQA